MTFSIFLIICCFILFICAIIFGRHKKEKRKEYIYTHFILVFISEILLGMAILSSFHSKMNKYLKICYYAQKILVYVIDSYNTDNKDNLFPKNCNNSELEKYQKELLLDNKYLKEQVYPTEFCSFEIKDSELFCIEHGSYNPKSKYYTDGFPVEGYTNINGNESVRKGIKEFKDKEKERYCSFIVGFIGLVAATKYFIFVLL